MRSTKERLLGFVIGDEESHLGLGKVAVPCWARICDRIGTWKNGQVKTRTLKIEACGTPAPFPMMAWHLREGVLSGGRPKLECLQTLHRRAINR
jgi:hypothetical protein